jgi:hypothetical protein
VSEKSVCTISRIGLCCSQPRLKTPEQKGATNQIPMRHDSSRRQRITASVVLALLVVSMQAALIAQDLGTTPQVNVAVQGEQGTQPEGTFLNLINWMGNVIAPVGARRAGVRKVGVHGNRSVAGLRYHATVGVLDCQRHRRRHLGMVAAGGVRVPAPSNVCRPF